MKPSNRLQRSTVISLLLLLSWTGLGLGIRLFNLGFKPPSSIEIATIGYSLGHGFNQIPLDRIVGLDTLLASLRLDTAIGYTEVFERLRAESTHPPLYFWLTRWWVGIWLNNGDLVSLSIARSLSALFGTLAIPSIFLLGWVGFGSRLIAHFAAILMAFSPYGIYLAQEARHYTLTILWVIASLFCLIEALKLIRQKKAVPLWLSFVWILVNGLGLATHYFYALSLSAEAIAVLIFVLLIRDRQPVRYLRSLSLVGIGTLVTGLVWLPLATSISGNEMTTWIATSYDLDDILLPIPRLLTWMITMLMLLPVEGVSKTIAVLSGLIILCVLVWAMPVLIQQWRRAIANFPTRYPTIIVLGYLFGSLVSFLVVIYGMGKDISLAARYHFVYFPALILLLAIALANCKLRATSYSYSKTHNKVVNIILIMALLGSLTVVTNFGFQKSRRSDSLAAYIQQTAKAPTLIAMSHNTHSEIRELVALASSFRRFEIIEHRSTAPLFVLVSNDRIEQENFASNLKQILRTQDRPLELVGLNLNFEDEDLAKLGCKRNKGRNLSDSGYGDRFFTCNFSNRD